VFQHVALGLKPIAEVVPVATTAGTPNRVGARLNLFL
jgi:hypothetical protein